MPATSLRTTFVLAAFALFAACGWGVIGHRPAQAAEASAVADPGYGPNPELPVAQHTLIPTLHIAPARPWADGGQPVPAPGLAVTALARGLSHPRWLLALGNGDVLVAETNAPARPEDARGLKGMVMKQVMKKAGAGARSADRITLLRDADGDGVAETRSVLVDQLHSPFGMALVGGRLYVADTDAVVSFPFQVGDTHIDAAPSILVALPAGPINHHWTKNLIANADGTKLYVTVGSNSNVAERGLDVEAGRAAIWEVDIPSGRHRVFASGLRNPNGLAWEPGSHALWTVVNERDELGDHLVPDYLTSVRDGGFYGWPWTYWGAHVDDRVAPTPPEKVARAIPPDYGLGAHTASLGLVFSDGSSLPSAYAHGVFIGQHGSWNRSDLAGYRVIFVPFDGASPAVGALPQEVLGGFVGPDGSARGRPVGVTLDAHGALLVADDVGNTVWRVAAAVAGR